VYVDDVKPLKRLYIHCTTTLNLRDDCNPRDAEHQINSTDGFKLDRVESSSNETKESSLFFFFHVLLLMLQNVQQSEQQQQLDERVIVYSINTSYHLLDHPSALVAAFSTLCFNLSVSPPFIVIKKGGDRRQTT